MPLCRQNVWPLASQMVCKIMNEKNCDWGPPASNGTRTPPHTSNEVRIPRPQASNTAAFLCTEGPHDENTKEAWSQAMILLSNTGIPFSEWKFWVWYLSKLTENKTSPSMWSHWRPWYHGVLPLTTTTIPDGYLFPSVIWKVYTHAHQSIKNSKNMVIGQLKKPQIDSRPCQSTRHMNRTVN